MHKFGNWGVFEITISVCLCLAICWKKKHNQLSEIKMIAYLLSMDKNRCAVLVYKLVAAVGVDVSHFRAVNVKGRLVLINSQPSRVHGRAFTQDLSERSRTSQGNITRSRHEKLNQMFKGSVCFTYFPALFRRQ